MKYRFAPLALTLLIAGASNMAHADWKDFYIKGGLANPQADSRDMTKTTKATKDFTLEAGYVMTPSNWNGEVRLYLGYVKMGGDVNYQPWVKGYGPDGSLVKMDATTFRNLDPKIQGNYDLMEESYSYDMTGHTAGIDFVFPFQVSGKKVSIFTGPSIHQWYMVRVNPKDAITERNLKAGWRLGGTYHFDEHTDLSVAYTQTEWRSSNKLTFENGANPSRPAYLSITAGYRF